MGDNCFRKLTVYKDLLFQLGRHLFIIRGLITKSLKFVYLLLISRLKNWAEVTMSIIETKSALWALSEVWADNLNRERQTITKNRYNFVKPWRLCTILQSKVTNILQSYDSRNQVNDHTRPSNFSACPLWTAQRIASAKKSSNLFLIKHVKPSCMFRPVHNWGIGLWLGSRHRNNRYRMCTPMLSQ